MKKYLMTPGPTPVPEDVAEVMARPIIHHRTQGYRDIVKGVNENLKKIFKTQNDVLTFTSSGTGAMEASVVNTLSAGDTAIFVNGGKFGERWGDICNAYGVKTVPIDVEWGTAPSPQAIEKALKENPESKAVFITLCETSTATAYDVKAIGSVVKKTNAILVVDVISGLGADEFRMDEWNVDIAVGGSQKGFMVPPGLAFCAVSKKAWGLIKQSKLPKFYYDFNKYEKLVGKSDSPFTPAITLVIGLERALLKITGEGVDNFIERHKKDAQFVREYMKDLGLKIFSKSPADAVTAVEVRESLDGVALVKSLKAKGVSFAGGQAHLKGKIFRIAHMGSVGRKDLEGALAILKETLEEQGVKAK